MARFSPLMAVPVVVFASFVGLFTKGMYRDDPESLPSALVGKSAPPLTAEEFTGKPGFDDIVLRDGNVKLVNFWASWCAPCRVEHPNLEALSNEGLSIYGINHKDRLVDATSFLAQLGDPYKGLVHDERGRTGIDWGVYGVPETYVIDGEGRIVLRFAGPITQRVIEATLRPAIEKAHSN